LTDTDRIEVVPLGGLGEFGMNMMAIRYGGTIVVVDAGLMFPRDDLLGVDIVVPELKCTLKSARNPIRSLANITCASASRSKCFDMAAVSLVRTFSDKASPMSSCFAAMRICIMYALGPPVSSATGVSSRVRKRRGP